MSKSQFLFGGNIPLLQVANFSQAYALHVENTFIMGKENPPVSLQTSSHIILEQENTGNAIYNTIRLLKINGHTDDDTMKPFLEQSLALADISPNLYIKRNLDGKILSVEKKEDLWKDWEKWKQNSLKTVFPEEKDQHKFTVNYENGLKDFDTSLKKNLQYILLMPEIYALIFPPNDHFSFLYNPLKLSSRLVEGMEYQYQMKLVTLEEDQEIISAELHAILNNKEDLMERYINKLYEGRQDFSVNDFSFSIQIKYIFEKSSAKIKKAELRFSEQLHADLVYMIQMDLGEFISEPMPAIL